MPDNSSQNPSQAPAFVEQADYEKGFAAFYESDVRPLLEILEANRLTALAEYRKRRVIGYALAAAFALVLFAMWKFSPESTRSAVPFYVFCAAAVGLFMWANAPRRAYASEEKLLLIPKITKFFGDFTYVPAGGMPDASIEQSAIIPIGYEHRLRTTDSVIGTRAGGSRMSVSHVYSDTGSGKGHRVLFDGELIMAEMPKKQFKGMTILRTFTSEFLGRYASNDSLQKVELEDPTIAAHFDIRSSDQVEARYLLTPDVMAKLDTIVQQSETRNLQCSFVASTLCISLKGAPNLFMTSGTDRSAFDPYDIRQFLERMHVALSVIDALED